MPLPFSYPLQSDPQGGGTGPTQPTTTRPYANQVGRAFLGFGITRPFRRDLTGDIVAEADLALVKACVAQVLGTRCSKPDSSTQGEVPWRPRFGALLHALRFRNNDPLTQQFAKLYVADALATWEPRVVLKSLRVRTENAGGGKGNVLALDLVYDVLTSNIEANQVLVADVAQTISVYREAA